MELDFDLYPKQMLALTTPAQLTVYGGAAGSGKSHVSRVGPIVSALSIPGLQVYLFRRHHSDLIKNHLEGPTGFRTMLSGLVSNKICEIVEDQIRFSNGSRIFLCHCQYDKDVHKFQGAEIHFLIPEETTQFSEYQLRFLFSRVRIPDSLPIPPADRHKWPRILMPTNPGGIGHNFVKTSFIDNREPMAIWQQPESDGGRTCTFIPARLSDNPSIDPTQYRAALMGLKRPELIDAMLEGKWDIPQGAFFPEADERKHLIKPFEIPRHWMKFRTFDWGSGAPFCVQWWAVSDGTIPPYPRGALICYREWYGCSITDTKKGIGLSNRQLAEGIVDKTPRSEDIYGTVTDSKPFQAGGGITIAEEFEQYGCPLTLGDVKPGSRIQGWQQMRSRLIGYKENPYLFFFSTCVHTWRTLVEIQVDPRNVEDLDSSAEDHPVDAASLACKARPFVVDPPKTETIVYKHEATFNEAFASHLKNMKSYASVRR